MIHIITTTLHIFISFHNSSSLVILFPLGPNHNCIVYLETGFEHPAMTRVRKLSYINGRNDPKINRRRKLYRVLESKIKIWQTVKILMICQSNACQKCWIRFRRMAGNLHGQGLQGHQQYQLFMKCYESGMSHLLLCSMSHWVAW